MESAAAFPIDPAPDSPAARSRLAGLDARSIVIKHSIKQALARSQAVVGALEKLEELESELFDSLAELDSHIASLPQTGSNHSASDRTRHDLLRQTASWKRKRRGEERDLVENLLIAPLRSLRMDYKSRGIGDSNHSALYVADRAVEKYYGSTERHLTTPAGRINVTDDSRQALREAEFVLSQFDSLSDYMWIVPPTSLPILDLSICICLWYTALTDSVGANRQGQPGTLARTRLNSGALETLTSVESDVDRAEGSRHDPHRTPSTLTLRQCIQGRLEELAREKEGLESLWAKRDGSRAALESDVAERRRTSHITRLHNGEEIPSYTQSGSQQPIRAPSATETDDIDTSLPSFSLQGVDRDDIGSKGKSRIRGFLSSTSLASALRGQAMKSLTQPPKSETTSDDRRRSFQLQRPSSSMPKHSKRSSLQAFPTATAATSNMRAFPTSSTTSGHFGNCDQDDLPPKSLAKAGTDENYPSLQRTASSSHKQGYLYSTGHWESMADSDKRDRSRLQRWWVVLAQGRICEYRLSSMEVHEAIDLRLASGRVARDTDRRFALEIITPTQGRRVYVAFSEVDLQDWLQGIHGGIESSLTSSAFDRAGPSGPELRQHAVPLEGRMRKTSMKHLAQAMRHSRNITGLGKPTPDRTGRRSVSPASDHSSLGIPAWTTSGTRASSRSSVERLATARPTLIHRGQGSSDSSALDFDEDTRAILRQYDAPEALQPEAGPTHDHRRRHTSDQPESSDISRQSSATTNIVRGDMWLLRRCLQNPENSSCLDCRSSFDSGGTWATIGLYNRPAVGFLCIDCSGAHRSMGSHVSKVRSVEMDKWTEDSILDATVWGNSRLNAIWEKDKPAEEFCPTEDSLARQAWIRRKYIEAPWVDPVDRGTWFGSDGQYAEGGMNVVGIAN